ncbi:hypothetical protein LAZ67_10003076 [Cordylochernes scorpioides]|uniref:Reverse transcriptase domain-containing protein n=1 Tax=Cordylochernes scorpioides TaxID=51811 RepID=A0ABY6L0E9_9ARAC|nr:hypothetical protein LAZ67_10003076 [Cordylochernes scorpioides]
MLQTAYGDAVLSRRRVFEWYKRFKEGREENADNERSGRPSTSTTSEKVDKGLELVREDRRIIVREVAEEAGISFSKRAVLFIQKNFDHCSKFKKALKDFPTTKPAYGSMISQSAPQGNQDLEKVGQRRQGDPKPDSNAIIIMEKQAANVKCLDTLDTEVCNINCKVECKYLTFVSYITSLTPPPRSIMVSFDVTSLYLSLAHPLIINSLRTFLENAPLLDTLTAETVVELTSICLGMSTFTFDTQFFKQTKGSPMGSPLSTVVAEVVMRSLDQWITSRHSSDIFLWRRYIDDTFCLVSEVSASHILSDLNSFHSDIAFTHETENHSNPPNIATLIRHPITRSSLHASSLRSGGAVYSVSCDQCNATYVGETGRSVAIRMIDLFWKFATTMLRVEPNFYVDLMDYTTKHYLLVGIINKYDEVTNYIYKPKYEPIEVFSFIGGYIGIWLGISLSSLADLLKILVALWS